MADKKYKLLLTGKNGVLIDVFFTHMQGEFECLTTSTRTDDILNHLKIYSPDAVIYCLNKETPESFEQIIACKPKITGAGIPLVIAGADADCEEFNKVSAHMSEMTLPRPFTASLLGERLTKFLDEKRPVREAAAEEQKLLEELEQETAAKKHILVIDDDPMVLKLVKEHLHDEYEVGTAVSGKVAMKFLEKKTVDMILLDFEMPEENGAEVLKKIHENPATKDIPVVFLTGITEKGKVREAIAQNPQDYLLKPIEKDKLMEAIERFTK